MGCPGGKRNDERRTRRGDIRTHSQRLEIPRTKPLNLYALYPSASLSLRPYPPIIPQAPRPRPGKQFPHALLKGSHPKPTTALLKQHRSAHIPTGYDAFSTLHPWMMDPETVRTAAPTRKWEYGPRFKKKGGGWRLAGVVSVGWGGGGGDIVDG